MYYQEIVSKSKHDSNHLNNANGSANNSRITHAENNTNDPTYDPHWLRVVESYGVTKDVPKSQMSQKFDKDMPKRNSIHDSYPQWSSADHEAMHHAANNFALKMSLLDFANKTSLNGPPFIIGSTNWITRSIWIFLFVCGIGLTFYNVIENVLEYVSWPIATQLSLDYSTLVFPMVTICNVNPIRRSYIKEMPDDMKGFLQSLNGEKLKRNQNATLPGRGRNRGVNQTTTNNNANKSHNRTTPTTKSGGQGGGNRTTSTTPATKRKRRAADSAPPGRKKRYIDDEQYDGQTNKSYIPDKYRKFQDALGGNQDVSFKVQDTFKFLFGSLNESMKIEAGHNLSHMMLQCSFETRECSQLDFQLVQTNAYGNCYSYNTDAKMVSKRRGQQYGLTMMMYLELDEYVMGLTSGYGIRVSFSDQNLLPFPEVEGVYVSAGMETDIGVRMVNVTRLGAPYGVCEKDVKYKKKYGVEYSRQFCQGTCEHQYIQDNCSCYERMNKRYYPKGDLDTLSDCSTDKEVNCMSDIKEKSLRNKLNCTCPSPCEEKTFDTEISSRQWPTPDYLDALVDKVCREELKRNGVTNCNKLINANEAKKMRNFLKVNVFYRDLNFQIVEEQASYPWYTFLSDLGGSVGLYLGISVLGLFEIIHLVLLIIHYTCRKLKKAGQLHHHRSDQPNPGVATSNM